MTFFSVKKNSPIIMSRHEDMNANRFSRVFSWKKSANVKWRQCFFTFYFSCSQSSHLLISFQP